MFGRIYRKNERQSLRTRFNLVMEPLQHQRRVIGLSAKGCGKAVPLPGLAGKRR